MPNGSHVSVPLALIETLQRELERLTRLVSLLHEEGYLPTHLYLLATLQTERAQLEREIRTYVDQGTVAPDALLTQLARVDRAIARLRTRPPRGTRT